MNGMSAALERLRFAVRTLPGILTGFSEPESEERPAPECWTRKEVIGHLIDSASNNHQRFVRGQIASGQDFPGYEQEKWVAAQAYARAPWSDLVDLWRSYNLQLSRGMAAMPADVRTRPRRRHNLHEIAWTAVPPDQPATLEYFLRDYVDHMRHHLAQILGTV